MVCCASHHNLLRLSVSYLAALSCSFVCRSIVICVHIDLMLLYFLFTCAYFVYDLHINKGQSNLALASNGIAANLEIPTPNPPFLWGRGTAGPEPWNNVTWTTWVSLPNGISFHTSALAWCTSVTDDIHTDGQMPPNMSIIEQHSYIIPSVMDSSYTESVVRLQLL